MTDVAKIVFIQVSGNIYGVVEPVVEPVVEAVCCSIGQGLILVNFQFLASRLVIDPCHW